MVEIAAVVTDLAGNVQREFVTLLNPERDIGPSSIHGLKSIDILKAPRFADIAGTLVDVLQGTRAIVGHNIRFDREFLAGEFERMGVGFPECPSLCTMQLGHGRKLTECCQERGIAFDGPAHHALADARATARLMAGLLAEQPALGARLVTAPPIAWPRVAPAFCGPISRDVSRQLQAEPPAYLATLLARARTMTDAKASDGAMMAYEALLDRVLEDRNTDPAEGEALIEMATRWGLSEAQISGTHRHYLNHLAMAAVADGHVTAVERADLHTVARLLGQDHLDWDNLLDEALAKLAGAVQSNRRIDANTDRSLQGKRVCFTGELQCCYQGDRITRERAEELAASVGLEVVASVTKKLDILVVADPHTQSGKADKARQHGIRIIHEPVFWGMVGLQVQ